MTFAEKMKGLAREAGKHLVLAEGLEPRTVKAARMIMDEKIAKSVTLVGKTDEVTENARKLGVSLDGIDISDPEKSDKKAEFANEYYELRKHKGMTPEQAALDITDPLRWAAMLVHLGYADAMVAGAESTTANVLRAALTIIKTKHSESYIRAACGDCRGSCEQLPRVPRCRACRIAPFILDKGFGKGRAHRQGHSSSCSCEGKVP